MLERTDRRKNVKIVLEEKDLARLVMKGTFASRHIYIYNDVQFVIVEMSKRVVVQARPILVGSQILALAKVYMLKFFYDVLAPNLDSASIGLFDTDGGICVAKTKDIYKDLEKIKDHFDFSGLPREHFLYSRENEKKVLYFKDESCGRKIKAFCSPRTKSYAILYEDDSSVKKLKGVQKSYVKKKMNFDHFKQCVLEKKTHTANFNSIISNKHTLYTVNINKLALESTDFKRVLCPNGRDTYAYGHWRLARAGVDTPDATTEEES